MNAADEAFARGDYQSARTLYQAVLRDPAASAEDKSHAQLRLNALLPDRLAIWLGLGTLVFIVLAYLLARFA